MARDIAIAISDNPLKYQDGIDLKIVEDGDDFIVSIKKQ